jgi:hypothetical protein
LRIISHCPTDRWVRRQIAVIIKPGCSVPESTTCYDNGLDATGISGT